jgi:hypothetical protein
VGPVIGGRRLTLSRFARAAAAAVGFSAGALGLAACGSSPKALADRSPQQILDAAAAAVKATSSFHATALGKNGSETLSTDINVFKNGDAAGNVVLNGSRIDMVAVGTTVYFNASQKVWETLHIAASAAATLAGKWAPVPAAAGVDVSGLNYQSITKQITDPGKVTYSSPSLTTIDGHKVIVLHFVQGSSSGTWYVADSGPAYPVRFVGGGGTSETLNLDDWNQGTVPTVPASTVALPGG